MAKHLTNPVITANGVDITDHVYGCDIEMAADEIDVTCFGSGWKETIKGLKDATITLQAYEDFAAGETYATIEPLFSSTTPVTIAVKAATGAISATNPEYQMSALLYTWHPINGDVGAASATELVFRNASQTGIVTDITP